VNRKTAVGLLVFANVLWGSSYVVAKIALEAALLVVQPLVGSLLGLALLASAALIFGALYMMTLPERVLIAAGDGVLDEISGAL